MFVSSNLAKDPFQILKMIDGHEHISNGVVARVAEDVPRYLYFGPIVSEIVMSFNGGRQFIHPVASGQRDFEDVGFRGSPRELYRILPLFLFLFQQVGALLAQDSWPDEQ